MAFINQETKEKLASGIKAVLKKHGVKGTIGIRHHTKLVVNVRSGSIDFCTPFNARRRDYVETRLGREYNDRDYFEANAYAPSDLGVKEVDDFMNELTAAMRGTEWYDNSDCQSDYFDIAYYMSINIGDYTRPYVYEEK